MPEIQNGKTLINVYNPSERATNSPGFNWYYLHTTALNVALVIQALHSINYVIGDLKPENLLVNERGLVSIIDTDSFQIFDSHTRKVYYSPVASSEYTPPEMFGKDLQIVKRSEEQDRFGLGVIIWLLLFGYHPFSGKWLGNDNQPSIDELIRDGYWMYGFNSKVSPHELSIPLKVLHPALQKCFHQCFSNGHNNPSARPSATEWIAALETARKSLIRCSIDVGHYYTSNYGKCCWCERKQLIGFDIFLSTASTSSSLNNVNFSRSTLEVTNPLSLNNHSPNITQASTNYIPMPKKTTVIKYALIAAIVLIIGYIKPISNIEAIFNFFAHLQPRTHQSNKILPDVFVQNYIASLNSHDYPDAWNYLSPRFKQNKDVLKYGYLSYVKFWEQFEKITIISANTLSKTEDKPTVDVRILGIFKDRKNKDFECYLRLFLIWDETAGKWLIDSSKPLSQSDSEC
jgi:DNA-binding helix-hairpin-helix protein with protein kinase domain